MKFFTGWLVGWGQNSVWGQVLGAHLIFTKCSNLTGWEGFSFFLWGWMLGFSYGCNQEGWTPQPPEENCDLLALKSDIHKVPPRAEVDIFRPVFHFRQVLTFFDKVWMLKHVESNYVEICWKLPKIFIELLSKKCYFPKMLNRCSKLVVSVENCQVCQKLSMLSAENCSNVLKYWRVLKVLQVRNFCGFASFMVYPQNRSNKGIGETLSCEIVLSKTQGNTLFLYKQPLYKQLVLKPLKNVATFEAQKSPVA